MPKVARCESGRESNPGLSALRGPRRLADDQLQPCAAKRYQKDREDENREAEVAYELYQVLPNGLSPRIWLFHGFSEKTQIIKTQIPTDPDLETYRAGGNKKEKKIIYARLLAISKRNPTYNPFLALDIPYLRTDTM